MIEARWMLVFHIGTEVDDKNLLFGEIHCLLHIGIHLATVVTTDFRTMILSR